MWFAKMSRFFRKASDAERTLLRSLLAFGFDLGEAIERERNPREHEGHPEEGDGGGKSLGEDGVVEYRKDRLEDEHLADQLRGKTGAHLVPEDVSAPARGDREEGDTEKEAGRLKDRPGDGFEGAVEKKAARREGKQRHALRRRPERHRKARMSLEPFGVRKGKPRPDDDRKNGRRHAPD